MESSKKLFLHIGHGKTGTSAFQAYLARGSVKFKSKGFCYPAHRNEEAAKNLKVTSGNLSIVSDIERSTWLEDQILSTIRDDNSSHSFIFSNEIVFHFLDPLFDAVQVLRDSNINLRILLSLRNPLDMIESEYQQLVKRHGYTETIDSFAVSRDYRCIHTQKSAQIVRKLEALGIEYNLFNYSALGRRIIPALADAIGVADYYPTESLTTKTINRSLSPSELQIVLFFNEFMGQEFGARLSNIFIDRFHVEERQKLAYNSNTIENIRNKMKSEVNYLNTRIQLSTPLSLDYNNEAAVIVPERLSGEKLELCKSIFNDFISHSFRKDVTP